MLLYDQLIKTIQMEAEEPAKHDGFQPAILVMMQETFDKMASESPSKVYESSIYHTVSLPLVWPSPMQIKGEISVYVELKNLKRKDAKFITCRLRRKLPSWIDSDNLIEVHYEDSHG